MLAGLHPAHGRGTPVVDTLYPVVGAVPGLPATQELQMHVGGPLVGLDGAAGRGQALGGEQPTEGALADRSSAGTHPGVRTVGGQGQQVQ